MADSKREVERKYEATPETRLPDLTRAAGVSAVVHRGLSELDAVYYDTEDFRLAADSLTPRRRTGGDDEGWHLKLPVSADVREEIQAPLTDALPHYPGTTGDEALQGLQLLCTDRAQLARAHGDWLAGELPREPVPLAMSFSASDPTLAPAGRHVVTGTTAVGRVSVVTEDRPTAQLGDRLGVVLPARPDAVFGPDGTRLAAAEPATAGLSRTGS